MFCSTYNNSYNRVYNRKLSPGSRVAAGCQSNLPREVEKLCSFNDHRNAAIAVESDAYPLSMSEEGSTGSFEYNSSSEPMSWEGVTIPELKDSITQYSSFEDDIGQSLAFNSFANGNFVPRTSNCRIPMPSVDEVSFMDNYSSAGFGRESGAGGYIGDINNQGYIGDINNQLPSTHRIPPSPVHNFFTKLPNTAPEPVSWKALIEKNAAEQAKRESQELVDSNPDDFKDGSFLFATAENANELKGTLTKEGLEIRNIWKTKTPGVLAVMFTTHEIAKQAFTRQKEIGVRLWPQSSTRRYWYKNPSPNFHVIFETTRRLTVKSGKSFSNKSVGDFLMKNARMERGCIIWADQMKGYRLRVVGFVGKFVRADGRVSVCNKPPSMDERKVIGWVSTQCNVTKTKFVLRLSGNQIADYLYTRAYE